MWEGIAGDRERECVGVGVCGEREGSKRFGSVGDREREYVGVGVCVGKERVQGSIRFKRA
jgi:hypothetical protein